MLSARLPCTSALRNRFVAITGKETNSTILSHNTISFLNDSDASSLILPSEHMPETVSKSLSLFFFFWILPFTFIIYRSFGICILEFNWVEECQSGMHYTVRSTKREITPNVHCIINSNLHGKKCAVLFKETNKQTKNINTKQNRDKFWTELLLAK